MKQRIQLKSLIVFQSDAPRHLRRNFRGLFMKFLPLGADGLMLPYHHHRYILGICEAEGVKKRRIPSDNLLCTGIKQKTQLILQFQFLIHSSFKMSLSIFSGLVTGAYLSTTVPPRETRNFEKFEQRFRILAIHINLCKQR